MWAELISLQRILWLLDYAACLLLAWRLWRLRLHCIYRFFFLYLVAWVVRNSFLLPLAPDTTAYGWIYLASEPVFWLLHLLIVLELYGLVLQQHSGIASFGRWAVLIGLVVAILISSATLFADFSSPAGKSPVLLYFFAVHRAILSALLFFMILISGFLVWYPISLSRNTLVYCVGYAAYFLGTSLGLLARNILGSDAIRVLNVALLALSTACVLGWLLLLNREGEARTVVVGHRWNPQDGDRLVEQLRSINSSLLRTARRG